MAHFVPTWCNDEICCFKLLFFIFISSEINNKQYLSSANQSIVEKCVTKSLTFWLIMREWSAGRIRLWYDSNEPWFGISMIVVLYCYIGQPLIVLVTVLWLCSHTVSFHLLPNTKRKKLWKLISRFKLSWIFYFKISKVLNLERLNFNFV